MLFRNSSSPAPAPRGARLDWRESVKASALFAILLMILAPLGLMLVISFKTKAQFMASPVLPTWPLHFENYAAAWKYVGPYIGRTMLVTVAATLMSVVFGSIAAFIFAQINFTGRRYFFGYVMLLMMLPGILNLIPLYVLVAHLDSGLRRLHDLLGPHALGAQWRFLNTLWALILPAAAGGQIMMIYVFRTFFASQPRALFEAAQLDGAGLFRSYWHVAFPLARPIIGTMATLNAVALWNDYIWPLVVLQRDHYTVSVGLRFMESQTYIEYGPLMAGYVMSSIPLVLMFVFTMKLFIEGLTSGAVKM